MGCRATVIKKYEIEYGKTRGFNWDADTLCTIIGYFCDDFYCGDDGCGGSSYDAYWEINKEQFAEMVKEIREMDETEFNERMEEDWFSAQLADDKPYSKKYVLDVFEGWLEETPKDSEYVRLGWL